jgi:hypothetical protein
MSAIIVSPTWAAYDHSSIAIVDFQEFRVDLNHHKLNMTPGGDILFGQCGIDRITDTSKEFQTDLHNTLAYFAILSLINPSSVRYTSESDSILAKHIKRFRHFIRIPQDEMVVITSAVRYVISAQKETAPDAIDITMMGQYWGGGSGGETGMGMAMAGMDPEDIFHKLHHLRYGVSKEFSFFNLTLRQFSSAHYKEAREDLKHVIPSLLPQ